MNSTQIKCFLTLAETLSFTETASRIYLSQQAVSKAIARLEAELGCRLFKRSKHSVVLTFAGRQYYFLFSGFENEFQLLKDELSRQNDDRVRLRVGYQIGLDFGPVPYNTQNSMGEKYPSFQHICERRAPIALQQMLLSGELDLIVIYRHFMSSVADILTEDLISFPVVLMIADSNPAAASAATIEDFRDVPFIFDSEEITTGKSEVRRKALAFAHDAGINPREVLLVYNRETAFTAAEQGQGFILTSRFSHAMGNPYMKSYPTENYETMTAVWRSGNDSEVIRDYVATLKEHLSGFALQSEIVAR